MSLLISQICEGCGKLRSQHTPAQRRKCSKIKQQMRFAGELLAEPINQHSKVSALPARSIPARHYSE